MHEQPEDIRAKFERIISLIKDKGLENVGMPYLGPLDGKLREIRMRGRDGIARAIFVTQKGQTHRGGSGLPKENPEDTH